MILIVVRFAVKPERVEEWMQRNEDFTKATRAEPGNIFFEWSRGVDDPNKFVLVEAFQDDAGAAHVNSEHFKAAMGWMPEFVQETPEIINVQNVPAEGWGKMAELEPHQ